LSEKIKLAIAVASSGQCKTAFAASLAGFVASLYAIKLWPSVGEFELNLQTIESSVIHSNREYLIKSALDNNSTHILFIDDDMKFSVEAVTSMFNRRHDIVITNYPKKGLPLTPTAVTMDKRFMISEGKTGIEEAYFGGFGLALFNADVFRNLKQPWFLPRWQEEAKEYTTEDFPLFDEARKAGYKCWVDHDASNMISHIGTYEYKWRSEENK